MQDLARTARDPRNWFLRKSIWLALISAITSTFLFAADKAQDKIPIFVKTAGSTAGFTDPSKDRQDSMKDLLNYFRNSKSVLIVESEKTALVVLEILDRGMKPEIDYRALNNAHVTVRLTAGEYSAELTGMDSTYRGAAVGIVKQTETWVKANREKLLALKK
jgi:hypothetical protein